MLVYILLHFPLVVATAETPSRLLTVPIDYWIEFKDHKLIDEELGCAEIRSIGMLADRPMTRENIVAFLNNYEPQLELYDWGIVDSSFDEF